MSEKEKLSSIIRRIDDLGRIAIPKAIRESLKIQEGDEIEVREEGNTIVLRKAEKEWEDVENAILKLFAVFMVGVSMEDAMTLTKDVLLDCNPNMQEKELLAFLKEETEKAAKRIRKYYSGCLSVSQIMELAKENEPIISHTYSILYQSTGNWKISAIWKKAEESKSFLSSLLCVGYGIDKGKKKLYAILQSAPEWEKEEDAVDFMKKEIYEEAKKIQLKT